MMFKHVKLSKDVAEAAKRLLCLRLRFTRPPVIFQWTPLTFSGVSEVAEQLRDQASRKKKTRTAGEKCSLIVFLRWQLDEDDA